MEQLKKLKKQFKNWFQKNPEFELKELTDIDVSEDPVRPELSLEWRLQNGRKIYGLTNEQKELMAVICVAFCTDVPKDTQELDTMSHDAFLQSTHRAGMIGDVAVAYTVWAKLKGGGKHILNEIYKKFKREHTINRLVTLSPLTDMARKFHLKNGAKELQVNETTQNFEYDITLEEWAQRFDKAKSILRIK